MSGEAKVRRHRRIAVGSGCIAIVAALVFAGTRPEVQKRITGGFEYVLDPPPVTLAEYNRLARGMSYDEVVEILGKPTRHVESLSSRQSKKDWYVWTGLENRVQVHCEFQNDRLTFMKQEGLK